MLKTILSLFIDTCEQRQKDRVGPLKDSAGNLIEEDNRMCDTLNNFFASVFTQENTDSCSGS